MKIKQPSYWYTNTTNPLSYLLLPFSWLFGLCVTIRQRLYQYNICKVKTFSVPVIVVGNITVGGTGKTPFVMWLANFLRTQGYQPGIVSRGVGGKQQVLPRQVKSNDVVAEVGDEALLLLASTNCPVVVGIDRAKAVEYLLQQTTCDIVISDDGLQHYKLGRALEIVMVDAVREFGNERLLPAGPLREPVKRLQQADLVVVTGETTKQEKLSAFTMTLAAMRCVSLNNPEHEIALTELMQQPVHAVAGIGHPERFFIMLRQAGLQIEEHIFPDHHLYRATDFANMSSYPILMTEKDAVKCRDFADERYWYLKITVTVDANVEQVLLNKLHEWSEKNEKEKLANLG